MMGLPVIVLAGGGTGGHVFPLVAVADALRAEADVDIVFVGTERGIETKVIPERGDKLELLDIRPIKGGGVTFALKGMYKAAAALPGAIALLARVGARAVLSAGGYVAGPVGLAAKLRGVPVALVIPDSIPGLANRWLLPFARRAYVAFPDVERRIGAIALCTGVPIRPGFGPRPYEPARDTFHVLVLGGSQGAAALNEVLPPAFAAAKQRAPSLSVTHQTGRDRAEEVRRRYDELGASAWVNVVPFIDDVAGALARAALVVERAGASVAELCAVGRPAILIPYPFAADDHQKKNGDALALLGAAVCIAQKDATKERLTDEIALLAADPERRRAMAAAAAEYGRPDAARAIARDLLALSGVPRREDRSHV